MKKKISKILIVLLYFTPCNIIILIYILFAWGGAYTTEKTYYIPQTNSYMKIYGPGGVPDIYVAFGDSINFTLAQSTSYFKLYELFGARIILDTRNKNIIYVDNIGKDGKIKNVIEYEQSFGIGTLLFDPVRLKEDGPVRFEIKSNYIAIRIHEYASSVLIKDKNMNSYNNIDPVMEKEYFNPEYFGSQFNWLMFWKKDNDKKTVNNVDFLFNLDSASQKK